MYNEEFFLSTDNDSHWYIVPYEKLEEWYKWLDIDSDDERSWEPPDFVVSVNGSPEGVIFKEPRIE